MTKTKGFMVYVEGMNKPDVVHREFDKAYGVAHNHARQNPGKEVFVFQLQSRIVCDDAGNVKRLPVKCPPEEPFTPTPEKPRRPLLRLNMLDRQPEKADT